MAKQPDQAWRDHVLSTLPRNEATLPIPTSLTPAPADAAMPNIGFTPMVPNFDALELLPVAAQDRLRRLRDRTADAHAVCVPFSDIQEASAQKNAAYNALHRLIDHPQDFGANIAETDPRAVAAQRHLDKMDDNLRRLQQRAELKMMAWQASSVALQNVEAFVRIGKPANTVFEVVEVEPVKPAKGENGVLDQIEGRRRRVRELKADLHRIASAPFPSTYCKSRVREAVEALAQIGAPVLTNVIEHDTAIIWPSKSVRSEVHGAERSLAFAEVPDALALIAYLHKSALIAALDAEIDAEADDDAALTHEARQVRTAEVLGDLLACERDEAELTWRAINERLPVEFRGDINPLAILAVELRTTPRALPPGTSIEHTVNFAVGGR